MYCRRLSITRFHRSGECTPPCGHPRLVLISLVAFLCVMVTCRLVTMFLIQPAVAESRGDWSIASEMALKNTLSKAPSMSKKEPSTYPFLAILRSYGVQGIAHSLIESYLSNRKQYVSVLGENSDLADVIYGVPQGSCLGPLLFLIYINDISNTSNEGEFILFADDTNIFVRSQTALLAFKTANEIIRKVNDYMYVNKRHINMGKNVALYILNLVILMKKI